MSAPEKLVEKVFRFDLRQLFKIGCRCFVAGTMVATSAGASPIETLRVGDTVLARDENTGETAYKPVIDIYVNDEDTVLGLTVGDATGYADMHRVTGNHPYWVQQRGWTAAEELNSEDVLTAESGVAQRLS